MKTIPELTEDVRFAFTKDAEAMVALGVAIRRQSDASRAANEARAELQKAKDALFEAISGRKSLTFEPGVPQSIGGCSVCGGDSPFCSAHRNTQAIGYMDSAAIQRAFENVNS